MWANLWAAFVLLVTHRRKVRILYKSGQSITFTCTKFTYDGTADGLTNLSWEGARPSPMYANLGAIEAVWQIR